MRKLLVMMFLALSMQPGIAQAADADSGNYYLKACTDWLSDYKRPDYEQGACLGFITASMEIYGMLTLSQVSPGPICTPAGVTYTQVARIWVKYMENHPEDLHEPPSNLYLRAMLEVYRCEDF